MLPEREREALRAQNATDMRAQEQWIRVEVESSLRKDSVGQLRRGVVRGGRRDLIEGVVGESSGEATMAQWRNVSCG